MEIKKLNMQALTDGTLVSYHDNSVALFTDLTHIKEIPITGVVFEGFLFAFVTRGQAQIVLGDQQYDLKTGDIFACNPKNILEKSMLSMDFDVRGIFIEPMYAEKMANVLNIDWSLRMMAQTHEIIHGEAEDIAMLQRYFDLLSMKIQQPKTPNKQQSLDALLSAMAYELFDIRERAGSQDPMPAQQYKAGENLFQRFVKMLSDPDMPFLSVAGYAEQLNITPKYFSAICRQLTGKNASTIIKEETILTAMILLRDNGKSIKQIADELGFKNQSHFGSFFRLHTGVSPQSYRHGAIVVTTF